MDSQERRNRPEFGAALSSGKKRKKKKKVGSEVFFCGAGEGGRGRRELRSGGDGPVSRTFRVCAVRVNSAGSLGREGFDGGRGK